MLRNEEHQRVFVLVVIGCGVLVCNCGSSCVFQLAIVASFAGPSKHEKTVAFGGCASGLCPWNRALAI